MDLYSDFLYSSRACGVPIGDGLPPEETLHALAIAWSITLSTCMGILNEAHRHRGVKVRAKGVDLGKEA